MLQSKNIELKKKLKNIISNVGLNKQLKKAVGKEFLDRNISAYRAVKTLQGNIDLDTLTDSEEDIRFLFLLSFFISKELENQDIEEIKLNVEDYFEELEIEKWKDYKESEKEESVFPFHLKDTKQLRENVWQTSISAQSLHKLSISNAIIYNPATQRKMKTTVYGKKIDMDVDRVEEITERLIKNKQFPTQIKFNALNNGTGEGRPIYNPKTKILTLTEECILNIFDGMHRKTANDWAINKKPDLDMEWSLLITYFTEDQVNDFIVEIDKQKPMDKKHIEQMDYEKQENLVVENIMMNRMSELKDKLGINNDDIKYDDNILTLKHVIATAVKDNYEKEIKTTLGVKDTASWIVDFTDYLMGIYEEEFIKNI